MKLALAVIAIGIAALAFGCSDSSETLTLEEYFAEFEAIDAVHGTEFVTIVEQIPDDDDDAYKDAAAAVAAVHRDAVDSYKALDPPSDVQNEHDDFVAAGEDFVAAWDEALDVIAEAETTADLGALIDEAVESIVVPAEMLFLDACFPVIAVGEANGITVDVSCEDRAEDRA